MSEIPKAYEPQSVESKWYQFWLDQNCFTADPSRVTEDRPAYSIVIPPPNVTGVLTLGHVLNNTIQDILARKARMDGKEVLWLPGTDHAGIATQNVVEKTLKKSGEIRHRNDLGREALVAKIWEWKEKYGGIILQQLKALGASCDWSRTRFTMDPEYSRCVTRVFVDLYKKGLIYRGKRMVNWCPASLTALSDEEVIMKPQNGSLYHFRVEVVEGDGTSVKISSTPLTPSLSPTGGEGARRAGEGEERQNSGAATDTEGRTWLTIATTRPETIPGDTAVAVNPKDRRYAHLIGKHVVRPLPAELPREQKLIPIVGDEHVDFEFGTGVLKVTPAHDKADFEIGQRHKLPVVEVINADGSMNSLAGEKLAGLDRFNARKVAVELLTELGAMEKEEPHTNNVGYSERADVPVEPRLSEQWFLKYPSVEKSKECVSAEEVVGSAPAPGAAIGALADGTRRGPKVVTDGASVTAPGAGALPGEKMQFYPQRWAKVYDHWMTGIQDWCISRQLWWGHRIPVWTKRFSKSEFRANKPLEELVELHCNAARCEAPDGSLNSFYTLKRDSFEPWPGGITWHDKVTSLRELGNDEFEFRVLTDSDEVIAQLSAAGMTQDPDVLDTWFSSWLWPFATMGWTGNKETDSKNPTLKAFYPTTDLVTGPDIIFFWVARMITAGHEYMGEMPFRNVYYTGIIRDKQGRKMSKSLGNSPDPLDLINKFGADALRFGIMRSAPQGQDLLFDEQAVELGRNFCNKLWNACRFRQMQGSAPSPDAPNSSSLFETEGEIRPELLTSDDKWILLKLNFAITEITDALTAYQFNQAAQVIYRFFWSEYCDWYVEASKAVFFGTDQNLKANTLAVIDFVLSNTLRLLHPFLPFITEELWQGMGFNQDLPEAQGGRTIMTARWPKPFDSDFRDFYGLDDCYIERTEAKYALVSEGRNLRREGNIPSSKKVNFVLKPSNGGIPPHQVEVLRILLNAEKLEVNPDYEAKKGTPAARSPLIGELYLPLEGLIDVEGERVRLAKEVEKTKSEIAKVEEKLANPNFTQKVPAAVLEDHKKRLVDWQAKLQQLQAALENLG